MLHPDCTHYILSPPSILCLFIPYALPISVQGAYLLLCSVSLDLTRVVCIALWFELPTEA